MPFKIKKVRFVFARNGQTDEEQSDPGRSINSVGIDQALNLGQALSSVFFDLALVSPTKRNLQTADIVLNGAETELLTLNSLLNHPDDAVNNDIVEMYRSLGLSSLRAYLTHEKAASLKKFADHAAQEIENEIALRADEAYPFDVLILGNAVLMNAIITAMFPTLTAHMLDYIFPECGAVMVSDNLFGFIRYPTDQP